MEKLYIVCRADLEPGYQAVQSVHAAIQFAMEHPEMTVRWFGDSNTLALLSAPNERALLILLERARRLGLKSSMFREPDIGNQITAIALEPGGMTSWLCRKLPKALAPVAQLVAQ